MATGLDVRSPSARTILHDAARSRKQNRQVPCDRATAANHPMLLRDLVYLRQGIDPVGEQVSKHLP